MLKNEESSIGTQMKVQDLPPELQKKLVDQLGKGQNSPNWEEKITIERGFDGTDNALLRQGIRTWVIDEELWSELLVTYLNEKFGRVKASDLAIGLNVFLPLPLEQSSSKNVDSN
jgi:hypothetical protein